MSVILPFAAAVRDYVAAFASFALNEEGRNRAACRVVAIGYLAGFTRKAIGDNVRDVGGYDKQTWKSVNVSLSKAWRAIAGEHGAGDALAIAWARGDFSDSLTAAYTASAPPKSTKDVDKVTEAVKLLVSMDEEDVAAVLARVRSLQEIIATRKSVLSELSQEAKKVA